MCSRAIFGAILATVSVGTSGCKGLSTLDREHARSIIDSGNQEYIEAFARSDAKLLGEVYRDNGARLNRGGKVVYGAEDIAAQTQILMDLRGPTAVSLDTIEFWIVDGTIYEYGKWIYHYVAPNEGRDEGFYINVWQNQRNGMWRLAADISLP